MSTQYIECSNIRNKRLKCPHRAQTNENTELLSERRSNIQWAKTGISRNSAKDELHTLLLLTRLFAEDFDESVEDMSAFTKLNFYPFL